MNNLDVNSITLESLTAYIDTLHKITEYNFEDKLYEQASYVTFFGVLYAEVSNLLDTSLEELERELAIKKIEVKKSSTGTKVTVEDLNNIAATSCVALKEKIRELTKKQNLIKAVLRGLEHQKDCLIQISSNKRQERKFHD